MLSSLGRIVAVIGLRRGRHVPRHHFVEEPATGCDGRGRAAGPAAALGVTR